MEPIQYAAFRRTDLCMKAIGRLPVKTKRFVFSKMRHDCNQLTTQTFFPTFGFTAGQFATGQVLAENQRGKGLQLNKSKADDDE